MKQLVSKAIVLSRTNYGEADRILTVITLDVGKVRLLAKGVRKIKSKMAGGIELFSVTTIGYIQGRGDLATLVSSRLETHYGNIVKDMDRTMYAYEVLKRVNRLTEDRSDQEYFELIVGVLKLLNNSSVKLEIIRPWFEARLLMLGGTMPNLKTDVTGKPLLASMLYQFSFDDMAFVQQGGAPFKSKHIKLLRILFGSTNGRELVNVQSDAKDVLQAIGNLITAIARQHIAGMS